jgi:hypothetical protein
MKTSIPLFLLKSSIFPVLFMVLDIVPAIISSLVIVTTYRHVLALVLGLHAMPLLDIGCYLNDPKQEVNVVSVIVFEKLSAEQIKSRLERAMKLMAKLRYVV